MYINNTYAENATVKVDLNPVAAEFLYKVDTVYIAEAFQFALVLRILGVKFTG